MYFPSADSAAPHRFNFILNNNPVFAVLVDFQQILISQQRKNKIVIFWPVP